MTDLAAYRAFLEAKCRLSRSFGFGVADEDINPLLKPHQRACVRWALRGGRRALFEAFGLGKSFQQIEILRLVLAHLGSGRALIVAPLGVRQEFMRDAHTLATGDHPDITDAQRAELLAWNAGRPDRQPSITFVRRSAEVEAPGLYITNYESIRDGRLDPNLFDAASLDEASCLRGFGGTKTFREFMRLFERNDRIRYRFVATATPSPNAYIELLAYAAYLEILDVGQGKTRWFKRDSERADNLTLHPHKEREFWLWVNSWAVFLQKPSDLGFSDEGYELPPVDVRWHEIPTDHANAGAERDGQGRMFKASAFGVQEASREKRDSLDLRIEKLLEIRAEDPLAHRLIWHDLEDERRAVEAAIPGVVSVYGGRSLEWQEELAYALTAPIGGGRGQEKLIAYTELGESHATFQETELATSLRTGGGGALGANLVAYQCHGSNVGPAGTLRSGNGGLTGGVPFVAQSVTASYAKTCDAAGSNGGGPVNVVVGRRGVRRLTPRETERLQGVPDDWTRYGRDEKGRVYELKDSPRYRATGNGVTAAVAAWIGRRIIAARGSRLTPGPVREKERTK